MWTPGRARPATIAQKAPPPGSLSGRPRTRAPIRTAGHSAGLSSRSELRRREHGNICQVCTHWPRFQARAPHVPAGRRAEPRASIRYPVPDEASRNRAGDCNPASRFVKIVACTSQLPDQAVLIRCTLSSEPTAISPGSEIGPDAEMLNRKERRTLHVPHNSGTR